MKKTLALLLALAFLTVPVDFADARGGTPGGAARGGSRGADRARRSRRARDAKEDQARDDRENRDGLKRDAGRDAV